MFLKFLVKSFKWEKRYAKKNRIFDLEGLGDIVLKKFLSKSLRNNQNLQLLKAKLIHLTILIKEISIMLGELGALQPS